MNEPPLRALLVEADEKDYLRTRGLLDAVENTVYALDRVTTSAEAIRILQERRHDVYLIAGLDATQALDLVDCAQELRLTAPVLLLIGQSDPEVELAALRAGASDILIKGELSPCSLERAVRSAIERQRFGQGVEKLAVFPRRSPNPVVEFGAHSCMTYGNGAANDLARSLGEASLAAILPPDMAQIITESLRTGQTRQFQTAHGTRSFAWSFVPLTESRVVHGYATEITERLNLDAQLRHSVKMEAVGQLAAGIAHDFNNILTVVQGHSNLLLAALKENPQHSTPLQQICHSTDRAGNLIRQLLMFSRKQVMQARHLDLNEAIHNIDRMLQRMMGEDIAIEILEHENLPAIYGDTGMIEQVLMNLAVNARDAMPLGGKFVLATTIEKFTDSATSLNPEARAGEFVCLTVCDTGCGMDPITLNRVFEPFFTTKEVGKGTGLGLATVYGIVKQHQGWIEVESGVGAGTTFRIYWPSQAKVARAMPTAPVSEKVQGGTETILVVEDEGALRELVTEILSLYGYEIVCASSGVEALRVWETHHDDIDLLLTDMMMPEGVSGRELAERLQKQEHGLKVLYTSGYSPGMAGKDLALLEGFNFLPKPYPPTRLAEVVRECLDADQQPVAA